METEGLSPPGSSGPERGRTWYRGARDTRQNAGAPVPQGHTPQNVLWFLFFSLKTNIVSEAERPTTRLGRGPSRPLLVPKAHPPSPRGLHREGTQRGGRACTYVRGRALVGAWAGEGDEFMAPLVHDEAADCRTGNKGGDRGREKRSLQPAVTSHGPSAPAPCAEAEVPLLGPEVASGVN